MMQHVRRIILALLLSGALFAGAATPTLADTSPNANCIGAIATKSPSEVVAIAHADVSGTVSGENTVGVIASEICKG